MAGDMRFCPGHPCRTVAPRMRADLSYPRADNRPFRMADGPILCDSSPRTPIGNEHAIILSPPAGPLTTTASACAISLDCRPDGRDRFRRLESMPAHGSGVI